MATTPDPLAAPEIPANCLAAAEDLQVLIAGMRHMRSIFSAPPLARCSVRELQPGAAVSSEAELVDYARRSGNTFVIIR